MVKGTYVDKNGVRRGAWTQEEDDRLRAYVEQHGHWNWRLLPKFAGLDRCGKSCRLRWMNYLKPGVRRGDFSQEERDLIAKLHRQYGNKWSAIAAELPGRTDHGIKNYWHAHHKTTRRKNTARSSKCKSSGKDDDVDVFVLESSHDPVSPIPSDSSTDQSCSNISSMPTQTDHEVKDDDFLLSDTFWTHPFLLDTHSYHDYHHFRLCNIDDDDDDQGLFSPLFHQSYVTS